MNMRMNDMEQNVKERIEAEDKKKVGKFWLNVALGGVFGGIVGFLTALFSDVGSELSTKPFLELFADFQISLTTPFRVLMVISGVTFWIIGELFYRKAKKKWVSATDQDEVYEEVDTTLSIAMALISVMSILNLLCFGVANYMLPKTLKNLDDWIFWAAIVVFIVFVYGGFFLQRRIINFVKEMNPEKRGSLYDKKFKDRWFESCDEAEKMQIGMASYQSFQAVNVLCTILACILLLAGMVFEIGILPLFIVMLVWLTQTITYYVSAQKAQKLLNK